MKLHNKLIEHEFVEFIPDVLESDIIYISIPFATASHLCACGCGQKVVTPISPRDWKLTFDGESISLHPSIGNLQFPCRSHYFIRENKVIWADTWKSDKPIFPKTKSRVSKKKRFFDFFFKKKPVRVSHEKDDTSK